MVGFLQSPKTEGEGAAEEEKEDLKTQTSSDSKKPSIPNEPLDLLLPELEDIPLSFSDCFLDFDYSNGCYTEGIPELSGVSNMTDLGGNPVDFSSVEGVLGASKEIFKAGLDGVRVKEEVVKNEEIVVVERSVGMGCQKINENEGCLIEEGMGKVSLDGNRGGVNENVNNENNGDSEEDSDDESSCSTSSSSSSSSSSDDDEEEESGGTSGERKAKNVKKHMDMEEGEIMLSDVDADEMVGWSDNEDDDVGSGMSGPITSKNELKVLPPVPPVNVTLQPHHQTLPVGVILSILGAQVIVEGVEKHNPLNDGSILWITERRSPLGIVDEIFGPVKNPYYVVRYNSEIEVPTGIQQGTLISFVQEFSDHILNEKSLYQKGYDASGENDEELSEQLEFSDDEKEAEYKRSLKMKKRGKNDSKSKAGPKRKEKWQQRNNNNNSNDNQTGDKLPVIEEQTVPPLNQENHLGSSGLRQDFPSSGPPTGIWSSNNNNINNLFPHQHHHQQQQQSLGLPPNGMLWMQQQIQNPTPFQLYQTPLQTSAPPLNFNPLAGQPNFGAGPTWPPPTIDQNMLYSLQFGMGLPGQHPAMQSQGSQIGHSLHAPTVTLESPPNFNQDRGGGGGSRGGGVGGRGGYHRGRDRGRGSSGMRGRY